MSAPEKVRIAAFDYDDTIVEGQSGLLLARYLRARGLLTARALARLVWWGARYKLKLPHRQDEAREAVFSSLVHWNPDRAAELAADFHEKVLVPRIRRDAVAEIERRRREGCFLLIVSASFSCIIRPACERLSMDGFVATSMERRADGAYTGRVAGTVTEGPEKARAIRRFADERFGPGAWELAYAYGDHHSDRAMLELAREAFAVDADSGLARLAERRGWEQRVWR